MGLPHKKYTHIDGDGKYLVPISVSMGNIWYNRTMTKGSNMKDLKKMTVKELREYADEKGISLKGVRAKAEVLDRILQEDTSPKSEANENLITNEVTGNAQPDGPSQKPGSLKLSETEQIGSPGADRVYAKKEALATAKTAENVSNDNKVALWSEKNLRWNLVGYLNRGFSFVSKEDADKWLGLRGVREASPEEIKAHYGA